MGVYLPNMEMPIDGNETIIRIQPDGTVLDQYGHHLAITAAPVPPHGRLIDADELFKEMERKGWFDNADRDKAEDLVLAAPTVIPADGKDIKVPTREEGE